jgi:hypothetical protein
MLHKNAPSKGTLDGSRLNSQAPSAGDALVRILQIISDDIRSRRVIHSTSIARACD